MTDPGRIHMFHRIHMIQRIRSLVVFYPTVHPGFRRFHSIFVLIILVLSIPFTSIIFDDHAYAQNGSDEIDPLGLEKIWEHTREDNEATFWKLAWSPDNSMIAATFFDNTCLILDASNGSVIREIDFNENDPDTRCDGFSPNGTNPLRACAFSPDGTYLAVAGDDLKITILNTTTWEQDHVFIGHTGSILCLDFSPDGRYLASGSGTDKVIPQNSGENVTRVWDMETHLLEKTFRGHRDGVLGVKWSHSRDMIPSVSDDRTIKLWSFPSGELIRNMTGHTSGLLDVDWSPDDSRLMTGSRDYKIKLWNVSSGSLIATWSDNNCVRSVDFHPSHELAATSGVDQTLKIRDAGTGTSLRVFKDGIAQTAMVMCSKWSPDGQSIVSGLGKSHSIVLYRFGTADDSGEGWLNTGQQTTIILIVLSGIFIFFLYYPTMKKIRSRRR